jgi:hypothetical protein
MARKENALFALCALCLLNTAALSLNSGMVAQGANMISSGSICSEMPLGARPLSSL